MLDHLRDCWHANLSFKPRRIADIAQSYFQNRWSAKQTKALLELSISALDLFHFPENAQRFELHVFIKFKDASTVEVVDVIIGDVCSDSQGQDLKASRDSLE